jgi:hypothetical protein
MTNNFKKSRSLSLLILAQWNPWHLGFLDICFSTLVEVITKGALNGAQNYHLSSDNITPDNLVCYTHLDFLCKCFHFPNFPSNTKILQLCIYIHHSKTCGTVATTTTGVSTGMLMAPTQATVTATTSIYPRGRLICQNLCIPILSHWSQVNDIGKACDIVLPFFLLQP